MERELNIKDIGPINNLKIQVPPGGGIVVLRGQNGCGKSTALRAAESLLKGEGKLETRDGVRTSGRVEGFGAALVIGRKTTRSGELEVTSIESKLDISELVSPPIKDAAAADRQRIKALISLTGVEPSAEIFQQVLGEELLPYITAQTWANRDLIDLAAKAKRDLEGAARLKENESNLQEGSAQGCEKAATGVDVNVGWDEESIRQEYSDAVQRKSQLEANSRFADEQARRINEAEAKLADLQKNYSGPTSEQAIERMKESEAAADNAKVLIGEYEVDMTNEILELGRQIEAAKEKWKNKIEIAKMNYRKLCAAYDQNVEAANSAQSYESSIKALKETVEDVKAVEIPTSEELDAARQSVVLAEEKIQQGGVVRRALEQLDKAKQHREKAKVATEIANKLRDAARQVDDVLSKAVNVPQLFVRDGRILTNTGRGETLFSELSEGERWTLAFDCVARHVGKNGLLVLPQAAYEALDPQNRLHVHKLAKYHGIVVLTAEAADGELRAEKYIGGK